MCEDCREIVHVLTSEENVCLECGSEKLVKWNPVKGKCPKCGEKELERDITCAKFAQVRQSQRIKGRIFDPKPPAGSAKNNMIVLTGCQLTKLLLNSCKSVFNG